MNQGPVPDAVVLFVLKKSYSLQNSQPKNSPLPKRIYPGQYDHLFMEAKSLVMFDAMDGFRAEIMKQVTPFFTINHGYVNGILGD